MKEVNNLLNRLGELEDAPLIWVNKKIYDMAEEIERLNKENTILRQNSQYLVKQKDELEEVINKAIEFIENTRHTASMTLEEMCDLEDILKGVDKE